MELRNFMKKDILFYTFLVSLIIAIISYVVLLIIFMVIKSLDAATVFTSLICFIPTILIALTSFIGSKIKNKNSKIIKILIAILNSLVIFLVQVCIGGFFLFSIYVVSYAMKPTPIYTEAYQYKEALESVNWQSRIKHFPKEIPVDAQDIVFHKDSSNWFGSEDIGLKFKIDKQYIDNTLKQHHFIKKNIPFTMDEYYLRPPRFIMNDLKANMEEYKYYIIGNDDNDKNGYGKEYGIAVNENTNEIIFYYANPD